MDDGVDSEPRHDLVEPVPVADLERIRVVGQQPDLCHRPIHRHDRHAGLGEPLDDLAVPRPQGPPRRR